MEWNLRLRTVGAAFFGVTVLSSMTLASDGSLFRWTAPAAEAQLRADTTVVPSGQASVFAPAMTDGRDEPQLLVFSGSERVALGNHGERVIVAPGSYTVRVGSGATTQMMDFTVDVTAGETKVIRPAWGGLRIEVVDENNVPFRGTYEIIRMGDREVIGVGYGADSLQGERLRTWLLKPGLYRIVRTGETYRARRDFATVTVPEGGLVNFKLVLDEGTGNFRGAGIVAAEELGVPSAASQWTRRVTLGGALSLNSTDSVVGATNQTTFGGLAFLDSYVTYDDGKNFASGIFELEEGVLRVDPEVGKALPTQKTQDRLRFDLLYTRFTHERWGPYFRFGALTNLFASDVLATEDTVVAFNRLDGSRDEFLVPANGEFRTADGFGALRLREGAGINVRLFRNRFATLSWRGGVGFRQSIFNDAFVLNDLPSTPAEDYFEIDNFDEEGVETTVTGNIRLFNNLHWITDLELFGDFGELDDPTIDWRNTLSLRLTRTISVDYTADVLRQPQIIDETQLRQNILLRFSFDLF